MDGQSLSFITLTRRVAPASEAVPIDEQSLLLHRNYSFLLGATNEILSFLINRVNGACGYKKNRLGEKLYLFFNFTQNAY